MKSHLSLAPRTLILSGLLSLPLAAADLFTEPFNDEASAHVGTNNGSGGTVAYVDYSLLVIGAQQITIPEAPRSIPGAIPTRGVLLKIDYAAPTTDRIVNLIALDAPAGNRLAFTDNYRLKFDSYQRLSPSVTLAPAGGFPNETGTTEHLLWGIGYNANLPLGRSWRTGRGNGTWGWLATEGGYSATNGSDASVYVNGTLTGGRNLDPASADFAAYFLPAFSNTASPIPGAPANQWVETDITVLGGQVTVQFKGTTGTATKFFQNVQGSIAGAAMVGYEDASGSTSFDPDNQWMLVDNMIVEDLTPPTMTVAPLTPVSTWTGTPVQFSYTITNARTDAPLTISAVNFSGTNAADFSPVTPLPLVIPQGQSAILELAFNPLTGNNGVRTANLTIVSDDPQSPSFPITGLAARRSGPAFLTAHYKLDESSGTNFADSSGNGFTGGAQVREPLAFNQPSLLGTGSPGSATGFLPAQASNLGSYFAASPTHTPSFSLSLWIKPASTGSNRTLFQRDPDFDSTLDEIYGLILESSGRLVFRVASGEVLNSDAFTDTIVDGNTYHVAVTHLDTDGFGNASAQRSRLYINGRLIAETAAPDTTGFDDYPINPTVGSLHFASRTVAGHGYSGDLDDIQLYGTELSKEQIWQIFSAAGQTARASWQITDATRSGIFPNPSFFELTFPSSPDGTYRLFRSPDLTNWSPIGDSFPGHPTNLSTSTTDAAPPGTNTFYRISRE